MENMCFDSFDVALRFSWDIIESSVDRVDPEILGGQLEFLHCALAFSNQDVCDMHEQRAVWHALDLVLILKADLLIGKHKRRWTRSTFSLFAAAPMHEPI